MADLLGASIGEIRREVRRLLGDLPQTAHAKADADGVTTRFPLPDENIIGRTYIVREWYLLSGAYADVTRLTAVPYPSIVYVVGHTSSVSGDVTITGTNHNGESVSDTIVLSGLSTVAGTQVFSDITAVRVPPASEPNLDSISVYVPTSLVCTVDGEPNTDWVADYDSGIVEFTSPPSPPGAEILWSYRYVQFNEADVSSAINMAIANVSDWVAPLVVDEETVTPQPGMYEYPLPPGCRRLLRVEVKDTPESPYRVVRNWKVVRDAGESLLKFISQPSPGSTIRLHYVPGFAPFSSDATRIRGHLLLPSDAKWAVVYLACATLCEQKLLPRARTNQFKNAEGVNVPKIYEVQRIAADFRALAEIEVRRLRLGPRRWA